MKAKLKILSELTKVRITAFVTLTTAFGYICFTNDLSINLLTAVLGIFLLACGSAVINHIQESATDALMDRTRNRPIPSKRISVNDAARIAILLVGLGSVLLISNGFIPLLLGWLNLVWYNLVYTPLKKITPIAIIPGSLVGAIPPVVGWTSAGGNLFDPQILVIAFFFFIWQIPHFWLLLLVIGNDYEKAGFPTLTKIFNSVQLSRITFVWIAATAVASLLIPLFGIIKHPGFYFALFATGIWLMWNTSKLFRVSEEKLNFRFAFKEINIFVLLVMLIISLDQIIIFA